jgi:hypothetical protein
MVSGLPKRVLTRGNKNSPTQFIESYLRKINSKGEFPTYSNYEYGFYGGRRSISMAVEKFPRPGELGERAGKTIVKTRRGFHTHRSINPIDILASPLDLRSFIFNKKQRLHGVIIPDKMGNVIGYVVIRKMNSRKLIFQRREFGKLLRLLISPVTSSEKYAETLEILKQKFPNMYPVFRVFRVQSPPSVGPDFKAIKNELAAVGIQLRIVANKKSGYVFDGVRFVQKGS